MNILKTVCDIIRTQLSLDEDIEMNEDTLLDELDADSLDAVEIVMALEDEFDVEISDDDAESVRSVGDLVRVISSLIE